MMGRREGEAIEESTRLRGLVVLFIAACFAIYYPIFAGYIPFPADLVTNFPPWEGTPERAFLAKMTQPEMGDLVTAYYPWRSRLNTGFLHPGVPLWNHQILMGTPYEPEPMSAIFFPLNWLYSI